MSSSLLSPRLMAGAALVGVIGAAGAFILQQIYNEKSRTVIVQEVQNLDRQVTTLRSELASLKELQKETRRLRHVREKRAKREHKLPPNLVPSGDNIVAPDPDVSYASDSEYYTDYQSLVGTDGEMDLMDSEEYYDVHTDDDDVTVCGDLPRNGKSTATLFGPLDEDTLDTNMMTPRNNT